MNSRWSQQLITGNAVIDEHHFIIIKKLYELEQLQKLKPTKSEIMDALLFLETYTQMHFQAEEQFMDEQKCPVAQENKQQHKIFIEKIGDLNRQFSQGNISDALLGNIIKDLSDWITNHIQVVDMHIKVEESMD